MLKKQVLFKTRGMNKDLSVSAFSPEFAFENHNLRLSTNESNTQLSWVNERGTSAITLKKYNPSEPSELIDAFIQGYPIGTAILNNQLILFTTTNNSEEVQDDDGDYIYKLEYLDSLKTQMLLTTLYTGNLNFSAFHPLETLPSYEANHIQKVYWVDGRNQLRFINIAGTIREGMNTQFDSVPELQLLEEVKVSKIFGSTGVFASGVIQYAFTYYNKYGSESNIFYVSSLRYISPVDRGGRPDEKVSNSFHITVNHIDTNFDYLRIYSIHRSSLDAVPFCRRVTDIYLQDSLSYVDSGDPTKGYTVSYIDTGTGGDTIDPYELLYKGGEEVIASTLEQKDNTLFLGNIKIARPQLLSSLTESGYYDEVTHRIIPSYAVIGYVDNLRTIKYAAQSDIYTNGYDYFNQLTCNEGTLSGSLFISNNECGIPCTGFHRKDTYRLGVQFQYKTGKWSAPFYLDDYTIPEINTFTEGNNNQLSLLGLRVTLNSTLTEAIIGQGYKKARALIVYPDLKDRNTLCQGVVAPTVYTENGRWKDKGLLAQSSWFFRPKGYYSDEHSNGYWYGSDQGTYSPYSRDGYLLPYTSPSETYNPFNQNTSEIRQVEIQGCYDADDCFKVDWHVLTFHSPELEFEDTFYHINYDSMHALHVGKATFLKTFSDIDIQTESPTISNLGSGFVHKSFITGDSNYNGARGIIGGLFYDDFCVDDFEGDTFRADKGENSPFKWLVYPWHRSGSLNNDINRPANSGIQSARLKKKVISNLRYAKTTPLTDNLSDLRFTNNPVFFNADTPTVVKLASFERGSDSSREYSSNVYMGNIDTVLNPSNDSPLFYAFGGLGFWSGRVSTSFNSNEWYRFYDWDDDDKTSVWKWSNGAWDKLTSSPAQWIGDLYQDLTKTRDFVRMKYKSSPHLVLHYENDFTATILDNAYLPVIELRRTAYGSSSTEPLVKFGGTSLDALKENVWLPCGEPVVLGNGSKGTTVIDYKYGDTYYQRYDCLKTYPFTKEDENQIVEIGSFMLETHINIDGRYDRNRGQLSNINISPENFNLLNSVYSQKDNFFSYRIMDDDDYKYVTYPNQIAWSKTNNSSSDIDIWTNITLSNILEMDGNMGEVTSLQKLNNQLLCFQDSGISQILYNENTQISTAEGVPIEIANSDKVQGKRYLSNTVGCSNKWSIVNTPSGIYFMDSNDKNIYLLGNDLQNLSRQYGFSSWCKNNILSAAGQWSPMCFAASAGKNMFTGCYDRQNQDVLWINRDTALAFNETVGAFTSFYDYGNSSFFCNFYDTGLWLRNPYVSSGGVNHPCSIWKHQSGDYCSFFGDDKPYWMTLVGNPEPQLDKVFTNLEFRACIETDGKFNTVTSSFEPFLPFDNLEVWDEYQHGLSNLEYKTGHDAAVHYSNDGTSALKRKFRIWRCDIPRDNYRLCLMPSDLPSEPTEEDRRHYESAMEDYLSELEKGICRYYRRPRDRMRNPWLYLKLFKDQADNVNPLEKVEIHDIVMTYYV